MKNILFPVQKFIYLILSNLILTFHTIKNHCSYFILNIVIAPYHQKLSLILIHYNDNLSNVKLCNDYKNDFFKEKSLKLYEAKIYKLKTYLQTHKYRYYDVCMIRSLKTYFRE